MLLRFLPLLWLATSLPLFAQLGEATPTDAISVPEGFRVERLYSVPKETHGSWVSMTVDEKGRLYVSDQYGAIYRVPTPPPGETIDPIDVEKVPVDLGGAQGLLWAHDSLYAVLNTDDYLGRGLYRVRDTTGDDILDRVTLLKKFEEKGGEHGPHAVLLGPDGQSLYVVCGNQTALPEGASSRVPRLWAEDQILPRIYGRGFMKGVKAPRGWIAKTDPEGKSWEILATGFRNPYDAAFNRHGELFTYDADMEWDMNTPWYRPTRINHVVSGADFGWRNGSGKWPEYYPDSFGSVVDIGPGSPTGVVFGYGADFPARYQEALFICDWSYGELYAVHLQPEGSTYTGEFEEFMSARPLPLTDLVIHPDGSMIVAIGGRRVQSGLYRVTYEGSAPVKAAEPTEAGADARKRRRELESFHGQQSARAIAEAWPYLSSPDRGLRHAARVALEHQPLDLWLGLAASERNPHAQIMAIVAAARAGTRSEDPSIRQTLLSTLSRIDYEALPTRQRLHLLRAYSLTILRHAGGYPNQLTPQQRQRVLRHLAPHFPADNPAENVELSQLLANLHDPELPSKAVALLQRVPTQEQQIALAKNIRLTRNGWTDELREDYFQWFVRAQTYRGGASFTKFVDFIRKEAVAQLTPAQKKTLKPILEAKPDSEGPVFTAEPRSFVKAWTTEDFADVIHVGLEGNRSFENGRNLFGAASCYACHRFNQQGGAIGPDLTSVAGKFSPMDLLESILEPSKEISDQYGATVFRLEDGSQVVGRIMNLKGDTLRINTNMFDPDAITVIERSQVVDMKPSPISMMPPGLLNTLEKDDVLDLLAYLLSRGNPKDPMFE